jgi:hypothetical protein
MAYSCLEKHRDPNDFLPAQDRYVHPSADALLNAMSQMQLKATAESQDNFPAILVFRGVADTVSTAGLDGCGLLQGMYGSEASPELFSESPVKLVKPANSA